MTATPIRLPQSHAYLDRLGLRVNPFPMAPDAKRYFLTEPLEALVYELLFCIQQRKGFMLVTGEVGLGKTTLSRYLVAQLSPKENSIAVVLNSLLQEDDLLHQICLDFGLIQDHDDPPGRVMINRLNQFFLEQRLAGRNCVIFIDDAQNLTTASLELIRVLSNLETDMEKLVQVILIGQQELRDKLARSELRQLASRLALERELQPLSEADLRRYVDYKLAVSSSVGLISLNEAAHRRVARYSRGNLRRANRLLDRVLVGLLGKPGRQIDQALVKQAIRDIEHLEHGEEDAAATRFGLRRFLMVFLLAGLGILIAMAITIAASASGLISPAWQFAFRLSATAPVASTGQTPTTAPVLAETAAALPAVVDQPDADKPFEPPALDPQQMQTVAAVVADYGLSDSVPVWHAALLEGNPSTLLEQVLQPAGLILVRQRGVPDAEASVPAHGPGVHHLTLASHGEHWWVWRPDFRIEQLSFMLENAAVRALQEHLTLAGHYGAEIDGIAGSQTISGLMSFQRANGLPVTGQLDDHTLLLLHRFSPSAPMENSHDQ